MESIRAIETVYNGYRFRSRLEARWAVVFDAMGIDWEYEPEGFELPDGTKYLPDFLLHGFVGRGVEASHGDLWVEVKGKMNDRDLNKCSLFCGLNDRYGATERPVYIVGEIPPGSEFDMNVGDYMCDAATTGPFHSFSYIDGDGFGAALMVNGYGYPELVGADGNYFSDANVSGNDSITTAAYLLGKQARFEHGEDPAAKARRVKNEVMRRRATWRERLAHLNDHISE